MYIDDDTLRDALIGLGGAATALFCVFLARYCMEQRQEAPVRVIAADGLDTRAGHRVINPLYDGSAAIASNRNSLPGDDVRVITAISQQGNDSGGNGYITAADAFKVEIPQQPAPFDGTGAGAAAAAAAQPPAEPGPDAAGAIKDSNIAYSLGGVGR